ncbi:MAG: thiamine phosphate synthase [Bacteroidales bacterium]
MSSLTFSFDVELYLVTDRDLALGRPLTWVVEKAVKGGVTMVQLREKDLSTKDFIEEALLMKKLLRPFKVPLIINDRVDVAKGVNADGVHLGQNDIPPQMARDILGYDKIIGLSVESVEQAEEAYDMSINYVAVNPVFTTPTKEELINELGIEGVRQISSVSRHPVVGIGSIKEHNAAEIILAGADGVAVVSAICSAEDPGKAAKGLLKQVKKGKSLI